MTLRLAHICRHPIKAHGREDLASVRLSAEACLPWDRHWAVAHAASTFDRAAPEWTPCSQFQRAARTPTLMAISASYDEATGRMHLRHPDLPDLDFLPETEGARLINWLAPISPQDAFRPVALVKAPGRGMTDSDFPSVSIKNLASNAALSAHLGVALSRHRWRGNLWLDGLASWAEFDLIGRSLRIGDAVLEVREAIGRCKATTADPETGIVDADTLAGLRALIGAQHFGVYAVVTNGGSIAVNAPVEVL
ncbi:MOSC N-terminal beta barrel domain-containing protein [Paracoccaceae bacterium Fryx2]|nr:MOSC N-terminal beta barrel domain-containing protein [Paracoccaceae bacterium Fryx2]